MARAGTDRRSLRSAETVLRRLNAEGPLPTAEAELLLQACERRWRYHSGEVIVREGEIATAPLFLMAGWACRQRTLPDGRRQIFGFVVPGDMIVGPSGPPQLASLVAITSVETADAALVDTAVKNGGAPRLTAAMNLAGRREQARLLDHMVRLGRQTAYERMVHLLLELQDRLQVVGLGDDRRFPLPLTQEVLADALGLSIVHVNRTLQQLRGEGLIELRSGIAILLRREALMAIAGYTSAASPAR